ncbi:hypothetical protein NDU88_001845 [Pleurodeles waltl]|uniref:Uncharacterized protein n=1 Tax=Pleurodeles waltl TaxID=8319 RepID=A0AAV7W0M9_PLEWA|nr:hypothetical protein NDU88_001845 [Pleurodeles waltl]
MCREEGGKRRDTRKENRSCRVLRGDVATEEREEDDGDQKGARSVEMNSPVQSSDEAKGDPEKTRESSFAD